MSTTSGHTAASWKRRFGVTLVLLIFKLFVVTKWKDRKDDGFQEEGERAGVWVAARIKHAHI